MRALEAAIEGFNAMHMSDLTLILRGLLAKNASQLGQKGFAKELIGAVLREYTDVTPVEDLRIVFSCAVDVFREIGDFRLAFEAMEKFHALDSEVRSTSAKVRSLQSEAHREAEQARMDAELERLRAVELKVAHNELKKHAELLAKFANYDGLTGLANRRFFDETFDAYFRDAIETNRSLALIVCDIDKFKQVNDNYSHSVGDEVLRNVSKILVERCGSKYFPARFGGEELVILMPRTHLGEGLNFAQTLRAAIQAFDWEQVAPGLRLTASFGVSTAREGGPSAMFADADTLLYKSTQNGRNQVNGMRPEDAAEAA